MTQPTNIEQLIEAIEWSEADDFAPSAKVLHKPDAIKLVTSTYLQAVETERERIIERFKDEWLGDDYHGEAVADIIREMDTVNQELQSLKQTTDDE